MSWFAPVTNSWTASTGSTVNRVLEELLTEARLVVSEADGSAALVETLYASMRYRGQGHEIEVELPLTQVRPR